MHCFRIVVRGALIVVSAGLSMSCAVSVAPEELELGETEATSVALGTCPLTDPSCVGEVDPFPDRPPATDACAAYRTATLVANPSTIKHGQSTTIAWSVTYSRPSCIAPVIQVYGQPVAAQGSMVVTPLATWPYAMTIGGIPVTQTVVTVVLPAVVRIKGNTAEWRNLLIRAIQEPVPGVEALPQEQRPGRTVLLAHDVDMDLTNYENINISQGVTLTSERPPAGNVLQLSATRVGVPVLQQGPVARDSQRLGPRIYTRSRPKPLFHIQCNGENIFGDRVRLSGFRLQGPHLDIEEGDDNLERGILVSSCTGVEISNMEIFGWSGQGIYIQDPINVLSHFNDVSVHDNFAHHNQHGGGNGYGVEVAGGAQATIERNLFDFNRHAIASDADEGTSYRANHNLVLKGGGKHDRWYNVWTHQFDVHGDEDCLGVPFSCGNAGTLFEYVGNTFQYLMDNAIKIRGTPRNSAVISDNVFAHDDIDDAVTMNGEHVIVRTNNTLDSDQYGNYGVCDFDGDGMDDLFMATGVTWWFSSGGKREWRYLNTRREKLNEVGLGDFDGDGRCDVFSVQGGSWGIVKSGTGALSVLPGGPYTIPFNQLAFGDFNGDNRKDIFRRANDGQWFVVSPGVYPWTPLQSSSRPLSELRFADFDGNGVTDVARAVSGGWSVSWEGRTAWTLLSPAIPSGASVLIGNVDGIAGDDLVSFVPENNLIGTWQVSSGGSAPWKLLTRAIYPNTVENQNVRPAVWLKTFVGRFDVWNGADMLVIEHTRSSRIFSKGHSNLTPYGLYTY